MRPNHFFMLCKSAAKFRQLCTNVISLTELYVRLGKSPISDKMLESLYRDIFHHDVDDRQVDDAFRYIFTYYVASQH